MVPFSRPHMIFVGLPLQLYLYLVPFLRLPRWFPKLFKWSCDQEHIFWGQSIMYALVLLSISHENSQNLKCIVVPISNIWLGPVNLQMGHVTLTMPISGWFVIVCCRLHAHKLWWVTPETWLGVKNFNGLHDPDHAPSDSGLWSIGWNLLRSICQIWCNCSCLHQLRGYERRHKM